MGIYKGYGRKYSTKFSTIERSAVDIYFGARSATGLVRWKEEAWRSDADWNRAFPGLGSETWDTQFFGG
jgi:hypothetical protein